MGIKEDENKKPVPKACKTREQTNKEPTPTVGEPVLFKWSDKYCLGISEIDEQHQEFCRLVNGLFATEKTGVRSEGFIKDLLQGLKSFMKDHFAAEETLYMNSDYPDADAHTKAHRQFQKTILDFEERYSTQIIDHAELLDCLAKWFAEHMQKVDRGYVFYVTG